MHEGRLTRIVYDGHDVIHRDLTLTDDDRRFAEQLARAEIVVIDELKQGVRITAKWSYVGVVQFSNFELQIKPKLSSKDPDGENLALAEMLDFIFNLDDLRMFRRRLRGFDASGANLFKLIIAAFADACEEVVSRGILADYVAVEEQLPVLRGRMMLLQQMRVGLGRFDRLECEHDEQTFDICENRLLLAALMACSGKVRNKDLASQIERLLAIFEDAASVDMTFDFDEAYKAQSGAYNRLNAYYRQSHKLAALIMAGLGHRDIFATGGQQCFSFLFKMYEVFEKFVFKLLALELSGLNYRVYYQKEDSHILWNAGTNTSYASLRPDFVVENKARAGVYLPVDAKYKNYDERDGVDEFAKKITTGDIYQTFAYAHGYGHGQHSVIPTSIIVFPSSVNEAKARRVHVRRRLDDTLSGEVIVAPVNIRETLAAMNEGRSSGLMSEVVEAIVQVLKVGEAVS